MIIIIGGGGITLLAVMVAVLCWCDSTGIGFGEALSWIPLVLFCGVMLIAIVAHFIP